MAKKQKPEQEGTLASQVGASIQSEVATILGQMAQARGILSDAVSRLGRSFRGMEQESSTQKEAVKALLTTLAASEVGADKVSVQSFARETSEVLRQFTDLLAIVSKQSIKTVYRIDDMASELDEVFKLVASVNEIAEETFILAVNATIEAAHAGNAGRSFSVIAGNVRELSKKTQRFNDQIGAQIGKSRATVNEVRQIIAEMASRDLNVALSGKERVQQMLGQLQSYEQAMGETLEKVGGCADRVSAATSDAVTALQFEDILSQLLGSASRRTERVGQLSAEIHQMATTPEQPERAHALKAMVAAEVGVMSDPVHQDSMKPGEVELF